MRFPLAAKAAAILVVMLVLGAVLSRIDGLVRERQWRQQQAIAGVEQSLSGAQTLLGPLLQRQCSEHWEGISGKGNEQTRTNRKREFVLSAAPQRLAVASELQSEARYRGLFKVNGYAGKHVLEAHWPSLAALQPRREHKDSRLECAPATVLLSVSDVRGLRTVAVQADGGALAVLPGTGRGAHPRGLHAALSPGRSADAAAPLTVRIAVELVGTARIGLVPAADEVSWSLRSDWPHPSFRGRFLPASREITAQGFAAQWRVNSIASPAAADALKDHPLCARPVWTHDESGETAYAPPPDAHDKRDACLDTMDVALIDPVNTYVLTDRATKYALLFIVLTFAAVALTEVLARRRVHPIQYALVGLALALFYLLLLSLSEHVAFATAYAAASAACVALLGYYARHMLGGWKAGLAFGAGTAGLYGVLWVLLQMEQTALAIGSVLLFAVLAATMVATRRIDWYAMFESLRRGERPA